VIAGFRWDRKWVIVSADSGIFLSQRKHPRMALIKPSFHGTNMKEPNIPSDAYLHLNAPGMLEPAIIPLTLDLDSAKSRTVRVWDDNIEGIDEGDFVAEWVSKALQTSVRLVRKDPRYKRPIQQKYVDHLSSSEFTKQVRCHQNIDLLSWPPFLYTYINGTDSVVDCVC
jgi:uncharacterized protein YcbX